MDSFLPAVLHLLGFAGLVAFTLLPIRVWQLLVRRELFRIVSTNRVMAGFGVAVALALPFYIYLWGSTLSRLSICLTQGFCGANRASGLILLAIFGGYYLIFEAGLALTRLWHRRHSC